MIGKTTIREEDKLIVIREHVGLNLFLHIITFDYLIDVAMKQTNEEIMESFQCGEDVAQEVKYLAKQINTRRAFNAYERSMNDVIECLKENVR